VSLCGSIQETDLEQANGPEGETLNRCFPRGGGAAALTYEAVSKDALTIKLLSLFFVPGFLVGLQFYNRGGTRTCHGGAGSDFPSGLGSVVSTFISIITAFFFFLF